MLLAASCVHIVCCVCGVVDGVEVVCFGSDTADFGQPVVVVGKPFAEAFETAVVGVEGQAISGQRFSGEMSDRS